MNTFLTIKNVSVQKKQISAHTYIKVEKDGEEKQNYFVRKIPHLLDKLFTLKKKNMYNLGKQRKMRKAKFSALIGFQLKFADVFYKFGKRR